MPQLHPPLHHNLSSGEIQALLFKRKNGWTVKTALEEAHHLGYDLPVGKRPHVTARYVQFVQSIPIIINIIFVRYFSQFQTE